MATSSFELSASFSAIGDPTGELTLVGFRVATVTEPSKLTLAAFGIVGLLIAARRKR